MNFFISLLVFGVITVGSMAEANQQQKAAEAEEKSTAPIIKESLFLTMERTPCYGTCPSYKITLFNTGRILYEGKDHAKIKGNRTGQLTPEQVKEIESKIEELGIYEMENKYDTNITDIPACKLYINYQEKKKKIYNRHGGPDKLKQFEKLIDSLVLNSKLVKTKDK